MIFHLYKHASWKPLRAIHQPLKAGVQARYLATVEANTPRQMPVSRPMATPVSHDRATFTIRARLVVLENACEMMLTIETEWTSL